MYQNDEIFSRTLVSDFLSFGIISILCKSIQFSEKLWYRRRRGGHFCSLWKIKVSRLYLHTAQTSSSLGWSCKNHIHSPHRIGFWLQTSLHFLPFFSCSAARLWLLVLHNGMKQILTELFVNFSACLFWRLRRSGLTMGGILVCLATRTPASVAVEADAWVTVSVAEIALVLCLWSVGTAT